MLNPILWKKVQRQKHPGGWGIVEHQLHGIKVFKITVKSHKHPGIKLLSSESKTQMVNQRKQKVAFNSGTAHYPEILVIRIRSQAKLRQSQSYKFEIMPQFHILKYCKEGTLHETHLLKLLDKMCKNKMDPVRIVGATERTRDAGRTDGGTNGRSEKWKQIPPHPPPTPTPHNSFIVLGI